MPNSRITASTSRVDTPLMYISATASIPARDLSAAAFQRLRVERRAIMAGCLGNVDGDRARRRVDALGLVAVGIALAFGGALVGAGAQEPLPLDLHGKLERAAKDRGDVAGSVLDQMFQEGLDRRILPSVHSRFSMGGFATPWNIRMGRPCRGMPRQGRAAPRKPNFQTVTLRPANPQPQRLRVAAQLLRDRTDRRPFAGVLVRCSRTTQHPDIACLPEDSNAQK